MDGTARELNLESTNEGSVTTDMGDATMSEEKKLSSEDKIKARRLLTSYCEAQKKMEEAVVERSRCHNELLDLLPGGAFVFTPIGSFDVDYYMVNRDGHQININKVEKL